MARIFLLWLPKCDSPTVCTLLIRLVCKIFKLQDIAISFLYCLYTVSCISCLYPLVCIKSLSLQQFLLFLKFKPKKFELGKVNFFLFLNYCTYVVCLFKNARINTHKTSLNQKETNFFSCSFVSVIILNFCKTNSRILLRKNGALWWSSCYWQ
jgi:hypothetical protein